MPFSLCRSPVSSSRILSPPFPARQFFHKEAFASVQVLGKGGELDLLRTHNPSLSAVLRGTRDRSYGVQFNVRIVYSYDGGPKYVQSGVSARPTALIGT